MVNTNIPNLSSLRTLKAKVELFNGSTLTDTCTCSDYLQEFTVNREGVSSKFFGFGVCQELKVDLIDINRTLNPVTTQHTAKVAFGDGTNFDYPFPTFYITEVSVDEDDHTITATAYDSLYRASNHTFSELGLTAPYRLGDVAIAIADVLGVTTKTVNISSSAFEISYANGANFEGTENLRTVLDAIAEATQTIYYINYQNKLTFRRLSSSMDKYITRDAYYTFHSRTPRTLTAICSASELGDNVIASTGEEGITQYIRNNPFWELRDDIATLLDNALSAVGGQTITQFDCEWEGDHLLEIGDRLGIYDENGVVTRTYLLNDTVTYDGTLEEFTEWLFEDNESETAANPNSLGDVLKNTTAKVDKVSQEITLAVNKVEAMDSVVSELQVSTAGISASIQSVEKKTQDSIDNVNSDIETLSKEVNLKLDEDAVTIAIKTELESGVDKVTTAAKKYTFDDKGLNISSADSEISTNITEDGMRVYKGGSEVLTADNTGVKAQDLHAVTYLIIGDTSRLEDRLYRTACFWIGD